jgi:uncharacterized protein Veg
MPIKNLLFLSLVFLLPANAAYARLNGSKNEPKPELKQEESIRVDLLSGQVGDVNMREDINVIMAKVGRKRVKVKTDYLHMNAAVMHIIYFGKHQVRKNWESYFFGDPIFRTKENLGVGSTIGEFQKVYGKGEVKFEDGWSIFFSQFRIPVQSKSADFQSSDLYKDDKVTEIHAW